MKMRNDKFSSSSDRFVIFESICFIDEYISQSNGWKEPKG